MTAAIPKKTGQVFILTRKRNGSDRYRHSTIQVFQVPIATSADADAESKPNDGANRGGRDSKLQSMRSGPTAEYTNS